MTHITYSAEDHSRYSQIDPFTKDIQIPSIFSKVRHVIRGAKVLDAGGGDGILCREAIDRGAHFALNVDDDANMIILSYQAAKKSPAHADTIQHLNCGVETLVGKEEFDIAIGSWILNYAKTENQLYDYVKGIRSMLKPGGVFVGINDNPYDARIGLHSYSRYGFTKEITETKSGSPVIYCYDMIAGDIINYYHPPEVYERVFKDLDMEFFFDELDVETTDPSYWVDFFDRRHTPYISFQATKS